MHFSTVQRLKKYENKTKMLWKLWNHVHWMFVGVYLHLSDLTQEELKLLNEIRKAKQQLLLEIKVRLYYPIFLSHSLLIVY